MLDKYFLPSDGREKIKRQEAVNAALLILNSAISTDTSPRDLDYDIRMITKNLGPLVDEIQKVLDK